MTPLDLYFFAPSAPCRAVLLAIRNLKLPVNIKIINLFQKEQFNEEFRKINPQHCLPTIIDDGFTLWESRAITSYLVDKYSPGNPLYPTDLKERAIVNQRLYFDTFTLYPRIRAICLPVLYFNATTISDEHRKSLKEAFEFLDVFLKNDKWMAGDCVTIADFSILASISSVIHAGANIYEYKNLAEWYERCKSIVGYDENDEGAKIFGDRVKNTLIDKF